LNLQEKRTPITEKTWSIDPAALKNTINKIYKEGTRNILLPITLGYSSTGACDPLKEILNSVRELIKSHLDLRVFIWVDAATQGLPMAFLEKKFRPFSSPLVKGLVIDFHKLGGAPIPAGIVLYRRLLREMIQTPIDYLYEDDATISGSRPGFSALAIWANINSKRMRDWQREFIKLNNRKENFIRKLYKYFPEAKVLSTKNSLTCAIVVNKHFKRLSKSVEDKFSLDLAKIKYSSVERATKGFLVHYKLNFLSGFDPLSFFKDLDEIKHT
jgi:glutamate/tyrosine decarboxylase-like PLP-dependent enzyme